MSLDCLFILWVYSFELPSTSSTHCPEREAENGSAYTWKDPSRNLKSVGDQSSAKTETKASRGSYANHHAYQKSIDSPPYNLPAPAGLFSICNKNCWLENSPLIISPVLNPAVLWCTTLADANIRTRSNCTSPLHLRLHF